MLSFGIDSDSRIALVGPNGAGKSTLLKLFVGENRAVEGNISLRPGMVIGRYHQHSAEVLDPEATPVEYIERKFKDRLGDKGQQEWRSLVGSFGIPSSHHLEKIKTMSDGLKHRLVLAEIAMQKPHLLLFDEPTNASDLEGVDALAEAINAFEGGAWLGVGVGGAAGEGRGCNLCAHRRHPRPPPAAPAFRRAGVVVISHDFRLLSQILDGSKGGQIWEVDHGVKPFSGTIVDYKKQLRRAMKL
jgi:ATPase subunit of ABC transporter with duplicated ATPase domains